MAEASTPIVDLADLPPEASSARVRFAVATRCALGLNGRVAPMGCRDGEES